MNQSIRDHLSFLYGESRAGEIRDAINALLESAGSRLTTCQNSPKALSERDAILITYGDQVRKEGDSPLHTLDRFLSAWAAGVVSAVHILPFYPSSSDDGFSVMDYFSVDPALGTWDDISALGERFDLMFDAVFNHASARGVWFQKFLAQERGWESAFYEIKGDPDLSAVVRPRALPLLTTFETSAGPKRIWTTFSADQVDINFEDPRMLLRVLEALLFYVEHGARYIRLDAIAFLWKEPGTPCIHLPGTHTVIQLMRSVLDMVASWVVLITETNVPHADNVSYFGDGSNEAQMVYNFALPPLVFHTIRTGNATALCSWAHSLAQSNGSVTFFNFLASHDGIGLNPARGLLAETEIDALVRTAIAHGGYVSYKRLPDGSEAPYELNVNLFDALSDPSGGEADTVGIARFLAAHAIMFSLAGVPGIYFHSLFGSRGDCAGAEASGIPRRINREKLELERLERELSTPGSLRQQVFDGMRGMLAARAGHPAFSPFSPQEILNLGPEVVAIQRGAEVLCLTNVTSRPVSLDLPDRVSQWEVLYGSCERDGARLSLPAYGVLWLTK